MRSRTRGLSLRGRTLTANSIGSALRINLISAWRLNEASGNATDSFGSNTLSDNNTVTSATGLVYALARDFERDTSEFLSITSNASLQIGTSQSATFAAWVKAESANAFMMILSKDGEHDLRMGAGGTELEMTDVGGAAVVSTSGLNMQLATWYFVLGWQNAAAGTINIQVDNGTVFSTSGTLAAAGTGAFQIGGRGGGNTWDGLIGPVYFWKRVLSPNERTYLYNGGAGRPFPFP